MPPARAYRPGGVAITARGLNTMPLNSNNKPARFCWVDLAAADPRGAADFYRGMFGWQTRRKPANGGAFHYFMADGEAVASLYQLDSQQIAGAVPSHWTPYIAVANVDESAANAAALGGRVVVKPFNVDGIARVSLITDSGGALVGLWELAR
jgi:uncharacterized protein